MLHLVLSNIQQVWHNTAHALLVQAFPEGNNVSICNEKLPNESVYKRFLYILQVRYLQMESTTISCKCAGFWTRLIKMHDVD